MAVLGSSCDDPLHLYNPGVLCGTQGYEAIKRQLGSIVKVGGGNCKRMFHRKREKYALIMLLLFLFLQVCNTLDREYDAVQLDDGFRCITLNCVFAPTKVSWKLHGIKQKINLITNLNQIPEPSRRC